MATPAPEESTVSPLVVNRDALPTGDLSCRNRWGEFTTVAKEDIEFAIELARTVSVKTDTTFPHVFGNADGVKFKPADCSKKTLLEHAVGKNMEDKFVNEAGSFGQTFGQFRVVITKPSPLNGQTTFCGVVCLFIFLSSIELMYLCEMTHGTKAPGFEKGLCKPVRA